MIAPSLANTAAPSLPQLLHSAVRRESRVGQRCECLGSLVNPIPDDDDVAIRNGHVLRVASRGSEPRHLPLAT